MTSCLRFPRGFGRPTLLAAGLAAAIAVARCSPAGQDAPAAPALSETSAEPTAATDVKTPAASAIDQARRTWTPPTFEARQAERDAMVRTIRQYDLTDEAVLRAMAAVPRHAFVPETLLDRAYGDHPLPIGYGQTISQPYIVAEMTRQLALKPGAKVLEVGTGSGYQAAVLTHFTPYVYTMEIIGPLAEAAARRLDRLGYRVVEVRHGDGFLGWPEKGPFDAIIVTCAAGQIPPPLLKQLKPGGRMVIPVGGPLATQHLMLVEKDADGAVRSRALMAVRFVPLVRQDPTAR